MIRTPRAASLTAIGALVVALSGAAPREARAGTEEFSTFDAERQEEDDESLLDHLLTRPPAYWRDDWEGSKLAFRTLQGCLTSGQWFIRTDLRLETPLGEKARFVLITEESRSDISSYDFVDLHFRFPTAVGTADVMFRPTYDKSKQDLALALDRGSDTTSVRVVATFSFEDVFNNLWAFRQTRVGNQSESYEKHPFEPALAISARRERWRTSVGGKYLTPSLKRIPGPTDTDPDLLTTLWGTHAWAMLEAEALGLGWTLATDNLQASSSDQVEGVIGDNSNFRRSWEVETALRRRVGRVTVGGRWLYRDRDQNIAPPAGTRIFNAIDRVVGLEAHWPLASTVWIDVGALHDRVTVGESGPRRFPAYGTRSENRAFIGLSARFGKVHASGVEGIELDHEPYEVWGVHDKGFLHLQAGF